VKRAVPIALLIAVADQFTKWLVARFIEPGEPITVVDGFFRLVHWTNRGAAWGIFQDYNMMLVGVSLLTILALYLFRHSLQIHRPAGAVALGLIAGGIIGNVTDRVRLGHVVDFLDFYVGKYHWPAFNVADSAICVGVGLYIIVSWRAERQSA
jgi:signal peptidase II